MSKLGTMIAVSFSISAATPNQIRRSVIDGERERDQLQERLDDRVQEAEDDRRLEQVARRPDRDLSEDGDHDREDDRVRDERPEERLRPATRWRDSNSVAGRGTRTLGTPRLRRRSRGGRRRRARAAGRGRRGPRDRSSPTATRRSCGSSPRTKPCGHGEPYEPTDVEHRPRQPRRRAARAVGGGASSRSARRGADLGQGADRLPPRLPRRRAQPRLRLREVVAAPITEGTKPTTYARVVTDPASRASSRSSTGSSTSSTTATTRTRATGR